MLFAVAAAEPPDAAGHAASASMVAPRNQMTPPMATGTPLKAPNRLSYTPSQFQVALMEQKLVYPGSVSSR